MTTKIQNTSIISESSLVPFPGNPHFTEATTLLNTYSVRFVLSLLVNEIVHYIHLCAWLLSVNNMWDLSDLGFNMMNRLQGMRQQGQEVGWHIRKMLKYIQTSNARTGTRVPFCLIAGWWGHQNSQGMLSWMSGLKEGNLRVYSSSPGMEVSGVEVGDRKEEH